MPARPAVRSAALALALAALAPAAQALNIVLTDTGTTPMSALQFSAFRTAADYWQTQFSDNVTVYLSVSFGDLGAGVLGSTREERHIVDYSLLRSRLVADASSPVDALAVSHLQTGTSVSFLATQGDLSTRFDNDGSANNTLFSLTTANAKALGLDTPTNLTSPDGRITFANAFADSFVYSRTGGPPPGDKLDFITVAQHEIGHALGFLSGVDRIDFCVDHAVQCGTTGGFEDEPTYTALDLFRYSALGRLDLSVGGSPYFSLDGGASNLQDFSTGTAHGNGWQASHFGPDALTLFRPFVVYGQAYDATAVDLMAMDAIGWNLANPVPEPQAYALLLGGLGVIAWARRRHRNRRDG